MTRQARREEVRVKVEAAFPVAVVSMSRAEVPPNRFSVMGLELMTLG